MNCKIQFAIFIVILANNLTSAASKSLQGVHILDPEISEYKYYNSWNSDQWIKWVRNRFIQDQEERRTNDSTAESQPLVGSWVNIIVIASLDEIDSAFSEHSEKAYPETEDESRKMYFWSDISFSAFVVVRKSNQSISTSNPSTAEPKGEMEMDSMKNEIDADGNENGNAEEQLLQPIESDYNVFNCANKKMYINAKLDPETFNPIAIQNFFPKKVKNPKENLRIPLVTCVKVGQARGLLDEIKFQLGN